MKKEMIFAVLIGLALGLFITYGLYIARTSLTKTSPSTGTQSSSPSPVPSGLSSLAIHSPEDESVQTKKEVTVAGTTIANSFVVVFVNDEESITTADESGNFSVATDLQVGSNVIVVHAVDEDGAITTAERTVIYMTTSLTTGKEATPSASVKPSSSPSLRPRTSPSSSPSPKP